MRLQVGLVFGNALLTIALLVTAPAHAVSVTNSDDKDQKLTIVEGDAKQDHLLKPNGVLDAVCLKGCVIRLGESENDEYELEGTEIVSIEDGYLYFDGPEMKSESAPGQKPAPPPAQTPTPVNPPK